MSFSIKQKLYALATLVVIALIALFFVSQFMSLKQQKLNGVVVANSQLKTDMLMLRRNEKDFLMRQDLKYLDRFNGNMDKAEQTLATLIINLQDSGLNAEQAESIKKPLAEYKRIFNELIAQTQIKGLDKDSGHYGKLRKATHDLESHLNSKGDETALVQLLTLRRHEKDFILRDDPKYVSRLKSTADQLINLVQGDSVAVNFVRQYVNEFEAFFSITQTIGLSEKEGLRGQMRDAIHTVETALNEMSKFYEELVDSSIQQNQLMKIGFSLLISTFIVAVIVFISRQVLLPIKHLSASFADIRASDDLTKRVQILRDDEIGKAAKDFNTLLDYFHGMVLKINESVDRLESATNTVSRSVHITQKNVQQQATQSDMVATAVTEMGASANDIAKNAEQTADTVNSAHSSAELGARKVQMTINRVNNLANSLVEAGDAMSKLKGKSDGITSVLDVIKGIAEQTNLLALNAAIEAARAGEQGRGFAVVADEVRTLAIRTQDSTAEITTIINELQGSTTEIAGIVDKCREEGETSAKTAQEAGDVLQKIMAEMETVNQMTTEIATAVEQQSNVVEEINLNVMQITDLGGEINRESNANVAATKEVSDQAKLLHDTVNIFKV